MDIEYYLERGLFASRWLMAPFYVGLVGALVLLLFAFMQELFHFFAQLPDILPSDAVLASLSLIDLSLAGNLLMIVIFSGYENFVSRLDFNGHKDSPEWKNQVDFSGLKLKLIASIVAISGIHLLTIFMNIEKTSDREIQWMVIIHIVFVFSGVLLATRDKVANSAKAAKAPKGK